MADDIRALKDQATALLAKGKLPAALEAWRQVMDAAPEDLGAHQKAAEILQKLGRKGEAIEAYEEVAKRYAQKGLFFKASALCRVLTTLDPAHKRTQELIASLYSKSKAPAAAAKAPSAAPPPAPEVEIDIDVVVPAPAAPGTLPAIPLFSSLSKDELVTVLSSAMEVRAVTAGETVVAEGTPGDSMFALAEGNASVYRDYAGKTKRKVADVATGDIFGEAAMVSGAPRLATVVMESDGVALEFRRDAMSKVIARHAQVGQKIDQFYRERLLANVLRASPILRGLPDADKKGLAKSFQAVTFVDGQRIINEGQSPDSVYLLLRGKCAATHATGERYPDLKEGDLFGEVSVLLDGPATASVAALGPVLALRLGAREFKDRVMKDPGAALAVKKLAQVRLGRTQLYNDEIAEEAAEDGRV
jgi:cAMP-dependent protein kinase regulator